MLHQRIGQSDPSITRDEVLAALADIVSNPDFPATDRNRRFLDYVVRHALDGGFEKISGYHIATQVFGRSASFNPTADPIVRIEAAKLRRDLEVYYLKSGSKARVRIVLPRGGYIPLFQRIAATAPTASFDVNAVTVHAMPADQSALAQAEPAFRARVVDHLTRFSLLSIFAGPATVASDGLLDSDTVRELGRRNGTRFVLSGNAQNTDGADGRIVFTARLHDGHTGRLLWSEDISGHPAAMHEAVVARALSVQREWAARLLGDTAGGGP